MFVEMHYCDVMFQAGHTVINPSCTRQWAAELKHRPYGIDDVDLQAILAKASFVVIKADNLSEYDAELAAVFDAYEMESPNDILILESTEVIDAFSGYDYELCLLQRIID